VNNLSVDVKVADAAKAKPQAAGHLLFHCDLAPNIELASQTLLHAQKPARTTGIKCIASPIGDEPAQDPFNIGGSAGAFGIGEVMTSAPWRSKRSTDTRSSGRRALKIAVTDVPLAFAAFASGASVASPAPLPTATM
jgi:hypothetical protein